MPSKTSNYGGCDGKPMFDRDGNCVEINISSGFVRIDGMPVFRVVTSADGIRLQFADSNQVRSKYRGTRYIEIPADVLFTKLVKACS